MVQVPYNPTESVSPDVRAPDDTLHVSATPASFGGEIAGGLGAVGQGLRESGLFLDKAIATQATNRVQRQWQDMLYGTGLPKADGSGTDFGYKGLSAQEQINQRPQLTQALNNLIEQTKGGMYNLNQQTQFETESRRFQAYAESDLGRVFNNAHDTVFNASQQDAINLAQRAVQLNPAADPAQAINQINTAKTHMAALVYGPDNITSGQMDRINNETQQQVAQQRIQSFADRGELGTARRMLDDNKDLLAGTPSYSGLVSYVTGKELDGQATALTTSAMQAAGAVGAVGTVGAGQQSTLGSAAPAAPTQSPQGITGSPGSRTLDPRVAFPKGNLFPITEDLQADAHISPEKRAMLNMVAGKESSPGGDAWTMVNRQDGRAYGAFQFLPSTAREVFEQANIQGLPSNPREWTPLQQIQAASWLLDRDYKKNAGDAAADPEADWKAGKFKLDAISPTWVALQDHTPLTLTPGQTQEALTARHASATAAALQRIVESGAPPAVQQAAIARANTLLAIQQAKDNAALAVQTEHVNQVAGEVTTATLNAVRTGDPAQVSQLVAELPQRLAIPGMSPTLQQHLLMQPGRLLEQRTNGDSSNPGSDFNSILPKMTDKSISNADQLNVVLGDARLTPWGRAQAESLWHNATNPNTQAENFNRTQLLDLAQSLLGRTLPGTEAAASRYLSDVYETIQQQHAAGVPFKDMLAKGSSVSEYIKRGAEGVKRSFGDEVPLEGTGPGALPGAPPAFNPPSGLAPTVAKAVAEWPRRDAAAKDIAGLMENPSSQYKVAFDRVWKPLGWTADRILEENGRYLAAEQAAGRVAAGEIPPASPAPAPSAAP